MGPNHLQCFLTQIRSTAWLDEVLDMGLLDPPMENGPWPFFADVVRLAASHGSPLVSLRQRLYETRLSNEVQAFYLVDTTSGIGEPAAAIVLRVVNDHAGRGCRGS